MKLKEIGDLYFEILLSSSQANRFTKKSTLNEEELAKYQDEFERKTTANIGAKLF